jgi:pyruvate-formate lyase-activating enzyme
MSINIFMIKCSAPFTAISLLPNVLPRPCCWYDSEGGDDYKIDDNMSADFYMKRNMSLLDKVAVTKGNLPKGCNRCNKIEGKRAYYNSFNENHSLTKDDFLNDPKLLTHGDLSYLHIMFNNKCNLACRTCNMPFSSTHAREATGKNQVTHNIRKDSKLYNSLVKKSKSLKTLYLSGGETMYDDTTWDYFTKLWQLGRTPQIVLKVSTNGTIRLNEKQLEILKSFKKVEMHLSIDGVDKMAEYTRTGLKWNKFLSNFEIYAKHFEILTVITVSALNIFELEKTYNYWESLYNSTHTNFVDWPNQLSISNLSDTAKQHVRDTNDLSGHPSVENYLNVPAVTLQNKNTQEWIDYIDHRAISSGIWPKYKSYKELFPDYYKILAPV